MTAEEIEHVVTAVRRMLEQASDVAVTWDNGINEGVRWGSTQVEIEPNGTQTMTIRVNGGARNNIPHAGMVEIAPGRWAEWPTGRPFPVQQR